MVVDFSVLLAYIIGIVLLFILGRIFLEPLKWILKLLVKILIGGVALFVINIIGGIWGFEFDINIISASLVGFLGIPGFILLIVLKLFLSV